MEASKVGFRIHLSHMLDTFHKKDTAVEDKLAGNMGECMSCLDKGYQKR